MHLWTEYEGNTLAGYSLGRLSRSEGRSAFFITTAEGQPALLRLTESHFDEGELIERWRKAAAVSHPGLQAIRASGQTTFDGVALAFCLLEPTDASLSDVLRERVLSVEEAAEVTEAIAGALAALHAAGLIHGHVDAINVFAMAEAVKLRSDCARECTGDFEADTPEAREALRQRDVHDLGLLLRRCLTPQWEETTAMQLPSPFDRIVRRALNGSVDAAGIVAEVEGLKPARPVEMREPVPAAAVMTPVVPVAAAVRATEAARVAEPAVRAAGVSAGRRVVSTPPRASMAGANSPAAVSALLAEREPRSAGTVGAASAVDAEADGVRFASPRSGRTGSRPEGDGPAYGSLNLRLDRVRNRLRHNTGMASRGGLLQSLEMVRNGLVRRKAWVASGVGAAVLGFVLWNTTGGAHDASASAGQGQGVAVATAKAGAEPASTAGPQVPTHAPQQATTAGGARSQAAKTSLFTSGAQAGWHVIAYTYRYQNQAQTKAVKLKEKYTGMEPQVYSPTGRAPYFVALGGPLDSVSAMALRNRARRAGLPRDTYARNF
ncbi:hypothetical protein [Terriglobus sp.]|uniref:hypothetical protein n=1 Tax=Terriglobus sp. TaxID=1889013 RepID=UPI003AFF7C8C